MSKTGFLMGLMKALLLGMVALVVIVAAGVYILIVVVVGLALFLGKGLYRGARKIV